MALNGDEQKVALDKHHLVHFLKVKLRDEAKKKKKKMKTFIKIIINTLIILFLTFVEREVFALDFSLVFLLLANL